MAEVADSSWPLSKNFIQALLRMRQQKRQYNLKYVREIISKLASVTNDFPIFF